MSKLFVSHLNGTCWQLVSFFFKLFPIISRTSALSNQPTLLLESAINAALEQIKL